MDHRLLARCSSLIRMEAEVDHVRLGCPASVPADDGLDTLRQGEKMAAIGQFTSGLAHDFNNLLASIGGGLGLARIRLADGRPEDADHLLGLTLDSVARASALTRRLLDFTRLQPPDPEPVEVARLVAAMKALIQSAVGPQVRIETRMDQELWRTLCDANQLETVLLNLCINARDAMPEGGRLTIEARNAAAGEADAAARRGGAAPGDYVALLVTDTGAGMLPDVAARACDPFFTTKPVGQGTGLGLSQVRGFAEHAGGAVLIHSEAGWGTTVTVLLPRHADGAEDGSGKKPADATADGTQAIGDRTGCDVGRRSPPHPCCFACCGRPAPPCRMPGSPRGAGCRAS